MYLGPYYIGTTPLEEREREYKIIVASLIEKVRSVRV
jgi:hypothetical protein